MKNTGIWRYKQLLDPQVGDSFQLTLGEGGTDLEENADLAAALGIPQIHLKREDKNPTGSHKDRGLAFQISAHLQDGHKEFVVSSTGNTAISAIAICMEYDLKLHVFLSNNLPIHKLLRLERILGSIVDIKRDSSLEFGNIRLNFSDRPSSDSFKYAKKHDIISIRGSSDDFAPEGYKTIAFELVEAFPEAKMIFIPTSSGTTTKGIFEGYQQLIKEGSFKGKIPQIHIVQTQKVNTIARSYDSDFVSAKQSIIDSISDRVAHRKAQIDAALEVSGGTGWVVSDNEVLEAENILEEAGVVTSLEGTMTIAAIRKALLKGVEIVNTVCLITGTISK